MEQGCQERYSLEEVKPHVSSEQLKQFEAINQDVLVGKNSNLKWCSTPDCNGLVRRPGCLCKRRVTCTVCEKDTCFKCGKAWHDSKCVVEELDGAIARYLLVANCAKCNAPITKNGACNHMTCSRCNYEFCWICR